MNKKAQMSTGMKIFIAIVLIIFFIIFGITIYRNVVQGMLGGA
ncbi:MAG: hypothetical protein V1729_04160 [Candidatus Woesearchaeota archaeon]